MGIDNIFYLKKKKKKYISKEECGEENFHLEIAYKWISKYMNTFIKKEKSITLSTTSNYPVFHTTLSVKSRPKAEAQQLKAPIPPSSKKRKEKCGIYQTDILVLLREEKKSCSEVENLPHK